MSETQQLFTGEGLPISQIGNSVISAVMTAGGMAVILPPRAKIAAIFLTESANHAITGGLNIGTASNGTQIASAVAVGALSYQALWPASLTITLTSATTNTTIWVSAASSWNSANLQVQVVYFY